MGPKPARLPAHPRDASSPHWAISPRLDGVQTRSQAAREAQLRTPPPAEQANFDDAPSTPLHQGIPPQVSTLPPGAPRKTKARRTSGQLSPGAPVRRLDFDNHPLLADENMSR